MYIHNQEEESERDSLSKLVKAYVADGGSPFFLATLRCSLSPV